MTRRLLMAAALAAASLSACFPAGESLAGRGEIRLSGPAVLDRDHARYVLTRDLDVEGTVFVIKGSGITLDLGGHRVTYRRKAGEESAHGILLEGYNRRNVRILNGMVIQQGADCRGCSPIFLPNGVHDVEIAGLHIEYEAADASAIRMHWGSHSRIRDNVIVDRGDGLSNRHQGAAAIEAGRGEGMQIHRNVIRRTRHIGIRSGKDADIRDNDVIIDSCATNSTGIGAASGLISGNRVVGTGVHPIGIWPGSDIRVTDNFVHVQNTRPGEEYGNTGAACLRLTWGNDNVEVSDNIFVLQADENYAGTGHGSWGRALWVGLPKPGQKALFRRNLIIAGNRAGRAKAAAIAVVCENQSDGLVFEDNTVISNWGHVLLSDSYGHADGYTRFIRNRFIREGRHVDFQVVRSQYPGRPSTGLFFDNQYLNGAAIEQIELEFHGRGKKEVGFGRVLEVKVRDRGGSPVPEAEVRLFNARGEQTFGGVTDADGRLRVEVIDFYLTNDPKRQGAIRPAGQAGRRIEEGPHRLQARQGERETVQELQPAAGDTASTVLLVLEGP